MFLLAASRASSSVMNPGWASTSTSASRAARLVPGCTGSTGVSPCTTISCAPKARDSRASGAMRLGGTWVSSTPTINRVRLTRFRSRAARSRFGMRKWMFELSAWSVMAMAV